MTPISLRGGGNADFFPTQNAKSQDWSVVWGSNLFWHTLLTLQALFGIFTPSKSICTQRHTMQKFRSKKMQIFGLPRAMCHMGANTKILWYSDSWQKLAHNFFWRKSSFYVLKIAITIRLERSGGAYEVYSRCDDRQGKIFKGREILPIITFLMQYLVPPTHWWWKKGFVLELKCSSPGKMCKSQDDLSENYDDISKS